MRDLLHRAMWLQYPDFGWRREVDQKARLTQGGQLSNWYPLRNSNFAKLLYLIY